MIRVLIADDHPVVRKGIRQILMESGDEFRIAEAANGNEALEAIRQQLFDIVLLDITMPEKDGLETLQQLKAENPALHILILSIHSEEHYGPLVLKFGAAGYMPKASLPEELIKGIHRVVQGRKYVSTLLAEKLAGDLADAVHPYPHTALSNREYQVMIQLASGKTITDISSELCLSKKTISTYRSRILKKMDLANNAQLIHYVVKHHLIE